MSQQIHITVTPDLEEALNFLQKEFRLLDPSEIIKMSLSRSYNEAKREAHKKWKEEEIEKGIEEADRGNFASEQEVNIFFQKWTTPKNEKK